MPGPSARATTRMPHRPLSPWTTPTTTSPRTAYVVMLRASSEIAVASSVWSVVVRSTPAASALARCRATTTSASDSIEIRSSDSTATVAGLLLGLQQRQPLLEVERGRDVLEAHPE